MGNDMPADKWIQKFLAHLAVDRGASVYTQRNYKQALADYNAALALAPNHATSLYVRGVIRRKLGDTSGGDADIRAAGKIDPEIAESFAPYGLTQGN